MIDHTHDPALRSWVESAESHPDFPVQNLPLGVFSPPEGGPRPGVAIGDMILDLQAAGLAAGTALNGVLGGEARRALRQAVSALLSAGAPPRPELLHRAADCTMHLPARVGDYTDFYAGIHHATNVGRLFGREVPLLPNYRYVPIGYHGRASSLRPSGAEVRRPNGQRKRGNEEVPSFGPCRNLDYELELGIWIGTGNDLGTPIPIAGAADHIGGYCLLNDWSARDIQGWEYQPLGPFLGKSFCTTVSPWIVTPEALAPFHAPQPPRPDGDPAPLPYLAEVQGSAPDIELEVTLTTPGLRALGLPPHRLSLGSARALYWTPAQLVAHHASNGCNLQPGDLFGSGTLSGPTPDSYGSLLEISQGGRAAVTLASGETRRFLEDGDELALHGRARRDGWVTIGFGDCRGTVLPALPL